VHQKEIEGSKKKVKFGELVSDERLKPTLSLLTDPWPLLQSGLACCHALDSQLACVLSRIEAWWSAWRHLFYVHVEWDPARMGCHSGGEGGLWHQECAW
jgi:hypothetical protein